MNRLQRNMTLLGGIGLLMLVSPAVQAGGHYGHPRDIDRAIAISDIVLRALFPTQVVVVQPEPVVSYTTTVVTPGTVITPVYHPAPVYVSPVIHYSRPRYDHCRPSPRWYTPPRPQPHHRSAPSRPSHRAPSHAPQGRGHRR